MSELTDTINEIRNCIRNPKEGLPEEVFLLVSEITPLVNTDLLVRDDKGRVLLAWRDDRWYGAGWHVPGSILRVKETFDDRIQKCANNELHTTVTYNEEPLEIRSIIEHDFKERCHFITFVYDCKVPDDYIIDNGNLCVHENGYLCWHDHFPKDMLQCQMFYQKYFI